MIEIGLTGGIGSGKSTVAQGLVARGAVLIDADAIVRELQEPGRPVFDAMVARWGERIVAADGTLDRAAVAAIVFGDEAELAALNDLVHPAVVAEMSARRAALAASDAVVVTDIPLLVTKQGRSDRPEYRSLTAVCVVDTPEEVAVERLVADRGFTPDDARARIAQQATREQRLAFAHFVVDNSGTPAELEPQLDAAWAWMSGLGGDPSGGCAGEAVSPAR